MRTEEALLLLAPDGAIRWGNRAASELLGFTQDELATMALPLLGTPSAGPVASAFRALLNGENREAQGTARFPSKDEKRIAVHWTLWTLPSAAGERQILLSLSETAQASEEGPITSGYRDIFEHAVEGVFRTTVEGRFLEVNPALAKMYGYSSPSELMHGVRDLNHQLYVDPSRRTEFVRILQQRDFVADFESEVFTADGRVIWIAEYARTVRGLNGLPIYFEGSVIDVTERKQAEVALKRSEEKFRHLVEMTNVVPWEADLVSGRFTYVGPQAERFLGLSTDEWLEPGFWDRRVHPEDREWVSIVRGEAIHKGQSFECEYRMIRKDEQVVWTREIVSLLPTGTGYGTLGGFMLDVSYRREAEESLRESQHFIEQIASASPTISYLYDPSREQSIYVNGRVRDILGFSREALSEMQPLFILSLAHPDEVSGHREHLKKVYEEAPTKIIERELRLRSSEGTWVWLYSRECVFKRDSAGLAIRIIGTMEDITLHRHALDELEANEALFRRLAETTRVVPFDYDLASNRFTYVGPQAEALFGWPIQYGSTLDAWAAALHPDDLLEGCRFTTLEDGELPQEFETEFRVCTRDGNTVWLRQFVHPSFEEDNRPHVRGFFLDVTENKLLEEERERSRAEIRELAARAQKVREEERMSMAREIHDELGQSLTSLKLDLSWMGGRIAKLTPPSDSRSLAEKITHMEQVIAGTLQIVRRVLSELRPPLLDELGLADAIEWHSTDFARRVGLRCDLKLGRSEGVPIQVALATFRIFQEITTNIARHSKASRMSVRLEIHDFWLILEVSDNGKGMSDPEKGKKGHYGLLGMRERAWAFGGRLSVESELGKGTTISAALPLPRPLLDLPNSAGIRPDELPCVA
ncbi:MAG: putative Sensor histidine kinase [Chthoniobacter sp.]|nr:putative Sensor histidine kinase [Chthoniobacter sp.]